MINDFCIKFKINKQHLQGLKKLNSGKDLDSDPFIDGFFELTVGTCKIGYILNGNIPSDVCGGENILHWFELMAESYQLLKTEKPVYMTVLESYNQYIKYERSLDNIKITVLTSENKKIKKYVDVINFSEDSKEEQTISIKEKDFLDTLKAAYIEFRNIILEQNRLVSDSKILNTCSAILG